MPAINIRTVDKSKPGIVKSLLVLGLANGQRKENNIVKLQGPVFSIW